PLRSRPSAHPCFSFYYVLDRRDRHPFPTRRSSDLADQHLPCGHMRPRERFGEVEHGCEAYVATVEPLLPFVARARPERLREECLDRKSTRLNSSHQIISYAVFCLKKKNRCHHSSNQ